MQLYSAQETCMLVTKTRAVSLRQSFTTEDVDLGVTMQEICASFWYNILEHLLPL